MKKFFTILTVVLVFASFNLNAQNRNDAWLSYDNGVFMTDIGLLSGTPIYWANMFTPSQLSDYAGFSLSKIKVWDHTPYNGYLLIYQDNNASGPLDLVYTQQYSLSGTNDWAEIELTTPIAIDVTKNLWITFNNTDGEFTIPACDDSGDPNSRWISEDGREWSDASTVGMPPFTWMVRGFITDANNSVTELGSNSVNVFPNPTTSILNIVADNVLNVSIFDMTGRMVYHNVAFGHESSIDMSDYQSGIYMVRVATESGLITEKINLIK